jgi:hypothetical protein
MRLAIFSLCVTLLFGCNQQKPKMTDAQIQAIRAETPGMTSACLEKLRWGGIQALPEPFERCFEFEPAKLWKGIWVNQMEGSQFCPDPAPDSCPTKDVSYANDIWLKFGSNPPVELGRGGLYQVEFIGRKSDGKGTFGHFGMFGNEIIVDRLISIKEVEPPPPEPTKAEIVADMKRCEAAGTCKPNWSYINSLND